MPLVNIKLPVYQTYYRYPNRNPFVDFKIVHNNSYLLNDLSLEVKTDLMNKIKSITYDVCNNFIIYVYSAYSFTKFLLSELVKIRLVSINY